MHNFAKKFYTPRLQYALALHQRSASAVSRNLPTTIIRTSFSSPSVYC